MDKALWVRPSDREFVLDSQYAPRQVNKVGPGSRVSPMGEERIILPDTEDCNNPWLDLGRSGLPEPTNMCVVRWGEDWQNHSRRRNEDIKRGVT